MHVMYSCMGGTFLPFMQDGEWHGVITNLSSSPRAFLFKQLLSDEECDHLIRVVKFPPSCFTIIGLHNSDKIGMPVSLHDT